MDRNYELLQNDGKRYQAIPRSLGALSFKTYEEAKQRAGEILSFIGDVLEVIPGRDHPEYVE